MTSDTILNQISVARPCPADWEDMTGDDRVRFCGQCEKHVYNIAGIPAAEAVSLIQQSEGELCIRLHRRQDGTVLNGDCPVGVRRVWSRWKRLVGVVTAAAVVALAAKLAPSLEAGMPGTSVAASAAPAPPSPVVHAFRDFVSTLKDWLGITPEPNSFPVMGDICVPANWPATGEGESVDLPPPPPTAIRHTSS